MSDAIGPVSVSSSQEEVFLGQEISRQRDFSEATAEKIDDEVRKLITGIEEEVAKRLKDNRDRLERLATTLLEEETLEASDIDSLLDIKVKRDEKYEEKNQGRETDDEKQKPLDNADS
jgi:cell division protease FtsH